MEAATDKLRDTQREVMENARAEADLTSTRANALAFAMIGLSLAAGAVVFFVVYRISRELRVLAGELSEGAVQVAGAAAQVTSSSQSLAQGAVDQASSIQETSASNQEIESAARKNQDNSSAAAALMAASKEKFAQANCSLDDALAAMGEIAAQSDRISRIIKTIDEIAFQTNILALNAAVEAARAGEAGLGFAVVADEVRNLAQRCAQAAKDTSTLIEESIAKSAGGRVKVDQVAASIRGLTDAVSQVKTLVDEVQAGSQEQARGIEHIGQAMVSMEQTTQKTAANAETGAAAAEELNAQADHLKGIVNRLILMVNGA